MLYRLVGKADEQADAILLVSARKWGVDAAARYDLLILTALAAIAANPATVGSRRIHGMDALWSYHLRSARRWLPAEHRVGEPRHLVIYRLAQDGTVEILAFAHERQQLTRAARRALRDAKA